MSIPESFTEERQRKSPKDVLSGGYTLTEEEMRVIKECKRESFYYRALPLSIISMVITKKLISRGILSASTRFGPAPKMAFAAIFGYIAGQLSYTKTCMEKLKNLPNSPLGERIRQGRGMPQYRAPSELSDPNAPAYDTTMFQPADTQSSVPSFTSDDGLMGRPDDFSSPVQSYEEEGEEPKKKSILYENLRLKNRENYEVMLNQKADTMIKASEKEPERPKREVKKNIYGDIWEE